MHAFSSKNRQEMTNDKCIMLWARNKTRQLSSIWKCLNIKSEVTSKSLFRVKFVEQEAFPRLMGKVEFPELSESVISETIRQEPGPSTRRQARCPSRPARSRRDPGQPYGQSGTIMG